MRELSARARAIARPAADKWGEHGPTESDGASGTLPRVGLLDGKVIAVTGAGRGIGRAVALACAAEGASVIVNDYGVGIDGAEPSSEVADAVAAEIEAAGGAAIAVADDISTMEAGERLVQTAVDKFGRIDGAVCVAGILRERMLFNMSEEEWDGVIDTHLKGTFTVFRAASAVMRKQDGGGSLVAFTSGVGMWGSVSQANYAAAKGGIVALMRSAAVGLQRYNVNANCIAPVAQTRMAANVPGGTAETGEPEDVAPMVVYLLSDAAKDVTGQTYTVVGGKVALWSQPREIRSIVKDGRWTPAELAEKLPGAVGVDRLPMFDYIEMMQKKSDRGSGAEAGGAEAAAR
jgi:NAD(P)-dependent dehydrogenase (short-subunit alcohol dehydrogenase family)